ncbi:DUF2157 domain-containing protein [Sinimarinibacterium sp. CAU 1509]|uniref:DUF2157 domain-containing protein n=1 Tax=Sinimarinibacterium sp. CAU 1509 TaxID=2562283 RepID=UPI0010ABF0F4|nr:DUF2157 domain-containing protein [Sinimarinibacterium sp. CAU 1509]TJY63040.1 DUF2157 domain-containing protein [Sinimarinibacterium sp. CAU 1509]
MASKTDWLIGELPALERAGVIDAQTAQRLRAHYSAVASASGWARWLFPVLGALLIGLGIVLLVAHNWDQLSRPLRLLFAFAPMTLGQLACIAVLRRPAVSSGTRDAAALLTALGFAAALALVGQIFHFPGDLDAYLLSCALAALPLVYLMRSAAVAVLYAAALLGWSAAVASLQRHPLAVVGGYALLLPFLLLMPAAWRGPWRGGLMLSALVPMFFAAVMLSFPSVPRLGVLWATAFGVVLVWLQRRESATAGTGAGSGFGIAVPAWGYAGVAIASLIGTVPEIWHGWFWDLGPVDAVEAWIVVAAMLAAVFAAAWWALRHRDILLLTMCVPAWVMAVVALMDTRDIAVGLALGFNVLTLAIGLLTVRDGVAARRLDRVNAGMLLLLALVALRFFDNDWSFTVRGVAFVMVGSGFLLAHAWLRRRVRT